MAISRLKLLLLLCLTIIVGHISLYYADDSETTGAAADDTPTTTTSGAPADDSSSDSSSSSSSSEDHTLKSANPETSSDGSGGDDTTTADAAEADHNLQASQSADDSSSGDSKGDGSSSGKGAADTGQVMKIIKDTIREVNPIRLIKDLDPDPLIEIDGLNMKILKMPLSYFPGNYFSKMEHKTKMTRAELGKTVGADLDNKKDDIWVGLEPMLKLGKQKQLKLGDYFHFMGLNLDQYEDKYENIMLNAVRTPVTFIDNVAKHGIQLYIDKVKKFFKSQGGVTGVAMNLYKNQTGVDVAKYAQQAVDTVKKFDVNKEKLKLEKQWETYKKDADLKAKKQYKQMFGKGGQVEQVKIKSIKALNALIHFVKSMKGQGGDPIHALSDLVYKTMGPQGRAIVYIVYQPMATLMNQVFGPLLLIGKVLNQQEDPWDLVLALPPIIIQSSGGLFKPVLMVVEPLLRWFRFLSTGEYYRSMSCGLDLAAAHGVNIYGGAYKAKVLYANKTGGGGGGAHTDDHTVQSVLGDDETTTSGSSLDHTDGPSSSRKRRKRAATTAAASLTTKASTGGGGSADSTEIDLPDPTEPPPGKGHFDRYIKEKPHFNRKADKRLADSYQGGPPPGGYKMGLKNDGKLDLDDEDMVTRLLLSPDFLLKVGGPVFVPMASVLAPVLRAINTMVNSKIDFNTRVTEIPEILKGVGFVAPLADVIRIMLPIIKIVHAVNIGKISPTQLGVQSGSLVQQFTNPVLHEIVRNPGKLSRAMLAWLHGSGGLLAMIRMQVQGDVPQTAPGAAHVARDELRPYSDFIVRGLGEFMGGWLLTYVQACGPIGSMMGAMFGGLLGNIIDPKKFLEIPGHRVNLKQQPLKNMLVALDNLSMMTKSAHDKNTLLTALLGGQDPDVLRMVGIDIEKLTLAGIDAGLLLAGGKQLLSKEAQAKLASPESVGLNGAAMAKLGLDTANLLESGLLTANEAKLKEVGVDIKHLFNRYMRYCLVDEKKLSAAGIDIRAAVKLGIDLPVLLAGGIGALGPDLQKQLGIQAGESGSLDKLGIQSAKLKAIGIDPVHLAKHGLRDHEDMSDKLGLDVDDLLASAYVGFEPKVLAKAGINIPLMLSSGIDPKLLLIGGLKKHLNNDVSLGTLAKIGIDAKHINSIGININLILDHGVSIFSPMSMVKLGVDPMRNIIGVLSRHGLDSLTSGLGHSAQVSYGFVANILKIIEHLIGQLPSIYQLPYIGPKLQNPDGSWKGPAAIIMHQVIGIRNEKGTLLYVLRKVFAGHWTKKDTRELLGPLQQKFKGNKTTTTSKPRRIKPDQSKVDQYISKAVRLKVGQSRTTPKPGSYIALNSLKHLAVHPHKPIEPDVPHNEVHDEREDKVLKTFNEDLGSKDSTGDGTGAHHSGDASSGGSGGGAGGGSGGSTVKPTTKPPKGGMFSSLKRIG
ncbi:uncharacterized protein LOC128952022 [Oppia nitens]|uniref:uncharacterized protein LOC128952022 n=1 Tax=Oppia nitens TaxID=1686743 RepID=UPI0023DB9F75|nr:uncharacterized protein LOC128952022 [Oppia nitens]